MYSEAITKRTKGTLAILGKEKILNDCYLSGGTALALQLGHRLSFDLDFFTQKEFERKTIIQQMEKFGLKVDREAWRTILGKISDVKFSLFYYQYPLVFPTLDFLGINIADLKDVAAMKIDAIASRGTKRDFTDLFFLIKNGVELQDMLIYYDKKYRRLEMNRYHILKSLDYFGDADKDQDPKMLVSDYSWEEAKKFLQGKIKELI